MSKEKDFLERKLDSYTKGLSISKAKDFIKSRIETDPSNKGFNPGEINNFSEYAPLVNYLLQNKYLEEKEPLNGEEKTVKSIRYAWTSSGREWAFK